METSAYSQADFDNDLEESVQESGRHHRTIRHTAGYLAHNENLAHNRAKATKRNQTIQQQRLAQLGQNAISAHQAECGPPSPFTSSASPGNPSVAVSTGVQQPLQYIPNSDQQRQPAAPILRPPAFNQDIDESSRGGDHWGTSLSTAWPEMQLFEFDNSLDPALEPGAGWDGVQHQFPDSFSSSSLPGSESRTYTQREPINQDEGIQMSMNLRPSVSIPQGQLIPRGRETHRPQGAGRMPSALQMPPLNTGVNTAQHATVPPSMSSRGTAEVFTPSNSQHQGSRGTNTLIQGPHTSANRGEKRTAQQMYADGSEITVESAIPAASVRPEDHVPDTSTAVVAVKRQRKSRAAAVNCDGNRLHIVKRAYYHVRGHVAGIYAFPCDTLERPGMSTLEQAALSSAIYKEALLAAWEDLRDMGMKVPDTPTPGYTPEEAALLRTRFGTERLAVKRVACAITATFYGFKSPRGTPEEMTDIINANKQLANRLLHPVTKPTFVYREPFNIHPTNKNNMFRSPLIEEVIAMTWFKDNTGLAVVFPQYFNSNGNGELPLRVVALAATAIECAITEWKSGTLLVVKGETKGGHFTEPQYHDKYLRHVNNLNNWAAHDHGSAVRQYQKELLMHCLQRVGLHPDSDTAPTARDGELAGMTAEDFANDAA